MHAHKDSRHVCSKSPLNSTFAIMKVHARGRVDERTMVMALAIFPVARLVSCDAFLVYLGLVKRVATAIEHGPRDGLWSTVIIRVSVNLEAFQLYYVCACVRLPT